MRTPTALAARSGLVIAIAIVLTVSGVSRLVGSHSDQSRLDPNALRRSLSDARARWGARKPGNYEFVLSIPLGEDWWSRRFASYRVAAGASTTIAPPTGPLADVFRKGATIDALFDLIAERLDGSTDGGVAEFDNDLGYPTNVFIGTFSFVVPTFRTLLNGSAVDLLPEASVEASTTVRKNGSQCERPLANERSTMSTAPRLLCFASNPPSNELQTATDIQA